MYLTLIKTLLWLNILVPAIISGFYMLKLVEMILPYISESGVKSLSFEVKKQWRKNKLRIFSLFYLYCIYLSFMLMTPFFSIPRGRTTLTSNTFLDFYICIFILYLLYRGIKSGLLDLKNISIDFNVSLLTVKVDLRKMSKKLDKFRVAAAKLKYLKKFQKIGNYLEKKLEQRIVDEITSETTIHTAFENIIKGLLRGYAFLIFSLILHEYSFNDIFYPVLAISIISGLVYYILFREKPRYGSVDMDELIDELESNAENEKNENNCLMLNELIEKLKNCVMEYECDNKKSVVLIFGRTKCGKSSAIKNVFKDEYKRDRGSNDIIKSFTINEQLFAEIEKLGSPEFSKEKFDEYLEGKMIDSILFFHDSTEVSARIQMEISLLVSLVGGNYKGIVPILTKIDNVSPSRESVSNVEKWGNIKRIETEFVRFMKLYGIQNPGDIKFIASDPNAPDFWYGISELKEFILGTEEKTLKLLIDEVKSHRKNAENQRVLETLEEIRKMLEDQKKLESDLGNLVIKLLEKEPLRSEKNEFTE